MMLEDEAARLEKKRAANRRSYRKHRARRIAEVMAREAAIKADVVSLAEWKAQRSRQHAKRMTNAEFVERKRAKDRRADAKRQADDAKRERFETKLLAGIDRIVIGVV